MNTSHGKVSTSIQEHQNFASTSTIDFYTMNFSVFDQLTSVSDGEGTAVTNNDFSFPITVDVTLPVPSAQFGRTVATTQNYHSDAQVFSEGELQRSVPSPTAAVRPTFLARRARRSSPSLAPTVASMIARSRPTATP